ncbi:nucleotidyltransferase domain-containing protein [Desulfogranum japonicum]|uniref:nucleotidyltransferase domain-containing protein n=1 Tax=Desulfogranum japonicum TaxID=231447 RepID=UPI00048F9C5D|nr:nucleotidyltransferase family protein [Desulfogranum japonicum]
MSQDIVGKYSVQRTAHYVWKLLSPCNEELTDHDCQEIGPDFVDFVSVNWVTAFCYERLRETSAIYGLTEELQDRLRKECLANRLRNSLLKTALTELLRTFHEQGIEVVLLKGAATFSDGLYPQLGARWMVDLDLLIRENLLGKAREILIAAGYQEVVDPDKERDGLATDARHAHINEYAKPGTPVVIELHYHVSYGHGAYVLPVDVAWENTLPTEVDGVPCLVLNPTYRLLHNTVHGLLPSRDFIKGDIRMWHLLEFGYLVSRYQNKIDWQVWIEAGERGKYKTAFHAWLLLAQELMGLPWPLEDTPSTIGKLHAMRLQYGTVLGPAAHNSWLVQSLTLQEKSWLLLNKLYYYSTLPVWSWQNVCYTGGKGHFSVRIRFFIRKMLNRKSWIKI